MDERPLKLIARAPDGCRADLERLARRALDLGGAALQFEFGKEHVAFIAGCNQFLRLHFRGDHAGTVELPPAADLDGRPALGRVFQMFGWSAHDAAGVSGGAVDAAFQAAVAQGAPKL